MVTSSKLAYKFFSFFFLFSANQHQHYSFQDVWKWASGLDSTSGYLISYPHSQTIKSKNSKELHQPLCFFRTCTLYSYFDRDQYTGLALTAVTVDIPLEMVPNLIISILLDFFSLTITGYDFQGCRPPSSFRPCDVWSRARGGQPDIQPRPWRPSLSVPCTLAPCCEAWRKSRSQENYRTPHLLSRG